MSVDEVRKFRAGTGYRSNGGTDSYAIGSRVAKPRVEDGSRSRKHLSPTPSRVKEDLKRDCDDRRLPREFE